jgi:hypothetical protein
MAVPHCGANTAGGDVTQEHGVKGKMVSEDVIKKMKKQKKKVTRN